MKKAVTVEEYIENNDHFGEELARLREIILKSNMQETVKWGGPVYTVNGKNVAAIGAFKNHFALWFNNGALLKDEDGVLINANEGKTKALRQWRFEKGDEMDEVKILSYLNEAAENQLNGKVIKAEQKEEVIPAQMRKFFDEDKELEELFNKLTHGKRVEYGAYIAEAKQDKTKIKRMEKIIPMIKEGKGLYDKYKNC